MKQKKTHKLTILKQSCLRHLEEKFVEPEVSNYRLSSKSFSFGSYGGLTKTLSHSISLSSEAGNHDAINLVLGPFGAQQGRQAGTTASTSIPSYVKTIYHTFYPNFNLVPVKYGCRTQRDKIESSNNSSRNKS